MLADNFNVPANKLLNFKIEYILEGERKNFQPRSTWKQVLSILYLNCSSPLSLIQ